MRLDQPDWGDNSHSLAFELLNPTDPAVEEHFFVLLNAYWQPLEFDLPELPAGRCWGRLVDTGQPSPADFSEPVELLSDQTRTYITQSRSAVVLVERNAGTVPVG